MTELEIANFFIKKGVDDKKQVDHLKLQKLMYYAYGWNLAITDGERLFNEKFAAWAYGPVIESIYHWFKGWGRSPIDSLAGMVVGGVITYPQVEPTNTETYSLLQKIWQTHGKYSGIELSNETHEPGSPWDIARHQKHLKYLDDADIKTYFKARLNK